MTTLLLALVLAQAPSFPTADGCNTCRSVHGTDAATCTLLYCGPATLPVQITLTPRPAEAHAGWLHAVLIAHAAAQAADLSTTQYALGTGRYHEANPVLRPIAGGPIRMALVKSGLAVLTSAALVKLHRTHPRLAFALATASTVSAGVIAARNSKMSINP